MGNFGQNVISRNKVLMCMPCVSGLVPTPVVQSLLQLHKPCDCAFLTIDRQRIDKCRSYFAQQSIQGEFDYLFMIDDDNPIPPDTLVRFLEDDKDVVIAPILTRNPNAEGKHDMCAYYRTDNPIPNTDLPYYNFITKFRDDGYLHKIDAGGTGCILIKVEVLRKLAIKYQYIFEFGDIMVNGQRRTMSEDVEFCERAITAGFEIWLDDRVRPLHFGRPTVVQYGNL